MDNWEEYREELKRRQEAEDAKLIYEYGTADRKEIDRIKKEKKEDNSAGCFVILLLFIIIPFIIMLIGWLLGFDGGLRDMPWSPRHT